ncbi:hypothetical protein HNQ94_000953 [Salirhabdus euzebyi]|uniref:Uncharacterized protein n=1 Tax=Salirhabdus euzebyi TaxID=394506 RepID=A0A841Q343_9BACI|nr:hypothetical protein [Salirhabdus euzebyi]MBB6452508.1 hypothetical protein [Salirhabdus euzebyi]
MEGQTITFTESIYDGSSNSIGPLFESGKGKRSQPSIDFRNEMECQIDGVTVM